MELTEEQIEFLNKVCRRRENWTLNEENGKVDVIWDVNLFNMGLTEIPIKFGVVKNNFNCHNNNLTTLNNFPDYIGGYFYCYGNNLTDYFKSIKEEDFPHWKNLKWGWMLSEYPFMINTMKKYCDKDILIQGLNKYPQTKLYYRD
jgi:hypothetical protein